MQDGKGVIHKGRLHKSGEALSHMWTEAGEGMV